MNPRVSIIVANYNYGHYLAEALDSIRAQSISDWEAVIVDDGSTDDSIAIAERYLKDSRFRLIRQQHQGQPQTKNRGISEARGEFIAFLDADDRWLPTKLEKQLAIFRGRSNVGLVYTRRGFIDPSGTCCGIDQRPMYHGIVLNQLFRDNFVCFSSVLLPRAVITQVGQFDEGLQLSIDYDWWLRIARSYEFVGINEPLVEYRTGHANLSRRVAERLDTAMQIMRRFQSDYDQPPRLSPRTIRTAWADTLRHRGLVARQRWGAGLPYLVASLSWQPWRFSTWKAMAAALIPPWGRRLTRRLRGITHDWDAGLMRSAGGVRLA